MEIIFLLIVLAAVGSILWFVYNAIRSLTYTAKAIRAPKGSALGDSKLSHAERGEQLPWLPTPVARYSRKHGRIAAEDIPDNDPTSLLDLFEELVISAGKPNFFYGRIRAGRGVDESSMLVGSQATAFTRFLGWITLQRNGNSVEWHLMCSEVRLWRTPKEENSHFEFGPQQHGRHNSEDSQLPSIVLAILIEMWDRLFSNYTTPANAKKAEWFERFVMEMWVEAIDKSAILASRSQRLATAPPAIQTPSELQPETPPRVAVPERRRPSRRD